MFNMIVCVTLMFVLVFVYCIQYTREYVTDKTGKIFIIQLKSMLCDRNWCDALEISHNHLTNEIIEYRWRQSIKI